MLKTQDHDQSFFFSNSFAKILGLNKIAALKVDPEEITKSMIQILQLNRPILNIDGSSGPRSRV